MRKIAGMMRLGKKYQLDDIFEEALKRLKAQFPATLAARDFVTTGSNELPDWVEAHFHDITNLGEEMALWSILPIAYYTAASYEENIVSFEIVVVHRRSAHMGLPCDTADIHSLLSKSLV